MKRGFTLIELLVVVLIIAILAAVALPQYTKAVEKSRATEAMLMVKSLFGAQNRYYLQNDEYTNVMTALDVSIPCNSTGVPGSPGAVTYTCGKYQYVIHQNSPNITSIRVGGGLDGYRISMSPEDGIVCYYNISAPNAAKLEAFCKSFGIKCMKSDGTSVTAC
ncbi:prepilin-type N-terminal cleavage/methylation domain-containing protein [Parelusimicrobium proximum]|uniref:type IV pilin protein n=1 Tax=Parelusimicrobium proximum TaxID=3228953 RepID=UPI003D17BA05